MCPDQLMLPFILNTPLSNALSRTNTSGYWYLNYMVMKVLSDTTCDVQLIDKDIVASALRRKTTALTLELSSLENEKVKLEEIIASASTSVIYHDESNVKPFVVGDVVQHNWNEGGTWWDKYRITAIHNDDTTNPRYELTYSDDSMVHDVSPALIRHPESEIEKARRELPLLNKKIKVFRTNLAFVRMETTHGKTDVLTLDAMETLLEVVLAETESKPRDTSNNFSGSDTIKWTNCFGTSEEVLKLSERLIAGRKQALPPTQSSDVIEDITITRAMSLKQQIDTMYYGSEDARTKYWSLKDTADCHIYGGKYQEALVSLQEACQLWNHIVDSTSNNNSNNNNNNNSNNEDNRTDKTHPDMVIQSRNDLQITACQRVLSTKVSVSFKSGAMVDVYDPIAIEELTKLMASFNEVPTVSIPDLSVTDADVIDMTTPTPSTTTDAIADANSVANECCYCHQPSTQGIIISHGDFLCIDCQHNSPLSVYYTNSR